jgi:hypothetical protein
MTTTLHALGAFRNALKGLPGGEEIRGQGVLLPQPHPDPTPWVATTRSLSLFLRLQMLYA